MTEHENEEINRRIRPSHPGAVLADLMEDTGIGIPTLAGQLGLPEHQVREILAERQPITPDIAQRLHALYGSGDSIWLRMQTSYDNWRAPE